MKPYNGWHDGWRRDVQLADCIAALTGAGFHPIDAVVSLSIINNLLKICFYFQIVYHQP
jgi:hypothetical protein